MAISRKAKVRIAWAFVLGLIVALGAGFGDEIWALSKQIIIDLRSSCPLDPTIEELMRCEAEE